ncbi:MAG: ATP-binding cassette, subfamily bacterial, partial [Cryptosporangiaceae bacterium]|nr:ATP-binding cassette, subfamily bacterial [Cryptosporangiaceae bacterium]
MTPGNGMAGWEMLRSLSRRDQDVKDHKLAEGTGRRILGFARPYRGAIAAFLITVVGSAVIGVATPVLAGKVVNAITGHGKPSLVVWIAVLIAGLAFLDAGFSFVQRWHSARIGESIILDLRTAVFNH